MKIKKLTSIIIAAMMTATAVPFNEVTIPYNSFTSYAVETEANEIVAEGKCGENLTWTLDNAGFLYINGTGVMDSYDGYSNWEDYIDAISSVQIDKDVETIGDYAFYNCKNITYADLAPVIGAHAFEGCISLSSIGYYADRLPSEIKDYAFYGCDSLEFINIENPECVIADSPNVFPEHTEIMGYEGSTAQAYAEKYNRKFEVIPDTLAEGFIAKDDNPEYLSYSINSNGVLNIHVNGEMPAADGKYPWADFADRIDYIFVDGELDSYGDYAFSGFNLLRNAEFVPVVGEHAFENCKELLCVRSNSENPVEEIKDYAFYGCDMLDYVAIENPDCIIADSPNVFPEHTALHRLTLKSTTENSVKLK